MSLYSRPRWAISPWTGLAFSAVLFGVTAWLFSQKWAVPAATVAIIALALVLYTIVVNVVWAQERKRLAYVPTPHRDTYTPVSRRSWRARARLKA